MRIMRRGCHVLQLLLQDRRVIRERLDLIPRRVVPNDGPFTIRGRLLPVLLTVTAVWTR